MYHLFSGVLYVVFIGELLLEVHISFGAGQYDFGVRGDKGVSTFSDPRIPNVKWIYGANDHVQVCHFNDLHAAYCATEAMTQLFKIGRHFHSLNL